MNRGHRDSQRLFSVDRQHSQDDQAGDAYSSFLFAILPSHERMAIRGPYVAAETGLKSVTDVCSAPQCSHMMCVNTHFSRRFLATAGM
jgi:hypothetical protein